MSPLTSGATDFEIFCADGSWLPLMLAPPQNEGDPRTIEEALQPAATDEPFVNQLVPRVQEDWSGGVGIDYDAAYGCYTRTRGSRQTKDGKRSGGFVCPAGAATTVAIFATGAHPSNSPIVAFAEYNGDLYVAQQGISGSMGGRVVKLTGGTGAISEVLYTGVNTHLMRDLLVADDGAGATVLFATSESLTHTNGRLHKFDTAAGFWTSTTAGTEFAAARGLGRLGYVYWKTDDGNGDWRIVAITGAKKIAYTLPNLTPMTGTANWSADIKIGTTGSLQEIVAFRRHAFFAADDDLYDVNELGESQAMTSYLRKMLQTGNGLAVEHLNGYVYMAVGRGLIRIYVGNDGVLDESPLEGQCAPGWGTNVEGDFRGYVTAMCVDQGYLVVAVHVPTANKTYVFWGIDRRTVNVDTPNPMVWYGPEVEFSFDYKVTRMWTSALAGDLRLWIASQSVAGAVPRLDWVSLPVAGSPLQDIAAGGTHRFAANSDPTLLGTTIVNPRCRLELLVDSGGDKALLDQIYQYNVGSRGPLSSTNKLTLYARADPAPGSTAWTFQNDVTSGPSAPVSPVTVVSGNKLQLAVGLTSSGGSGTPPTIAVLDSLRSLVWQKAPALPVRTFTVQYGDGVDNIYGGSDIERSPDTKTNLLLTLTGIGQTTIRDRQNNRWIVELHQILNRHEELVDDGVWGKRVTCQIECSVTGSL